MRGGGEPSWARTKGTARDATNRAMNKAGCKGAGALYVKTMELKDPSGVTRVGGEKA